MRCHNDTLFGSAGIAMPRLLNSVCWLHKSRSVPIPGSAENGLRAELEPGFIRKAWGRQKKHTHTQQQNKPFVPCVCEIPLGIGM